MDLNIFKMDLDRNLDLFSSTGPAKKDLKLWDLDHIFGPDLNGGSRSFFLDLF